MCLSCDQKCLRLLDVNALGTQIPLYFDFHGQRMRLELMADCSTGADSIVSESGWSNSQMFETYYFSKYVQDRGKVDSATL